MESPFERDIRHLSLRTAPLGFTLAELLVVIAIISVLSSIIYNSLYRARVKAGDAAVIENLNNARTQAELFYLLNNNSFNNGVSEVCLTQTTALRGIYPFVQDAAQITAADARFQAAGGINIAICNSNATGWAAEAPLDSSGFYCVDNVKQGSSSPSTKITSAVDVSC